MGKINSRNKYLFPKTIYILLGSMLIYYWNVFFEDVKVLAKQIDNICNEYSKLYNYIANSHLMKKYIDDYKAMIFTQNSMVETFMDSFK